MVLNALRECARAPYDAIDRVSESHQWRNKAIARIQMRDFAKRIYFAKIRIPRSDSDETLLIKLLFHLNQQTREPRPCNHELLRSELSVSTLESIRMQKLR